LGEEIEDKEKVNSLEIEKKSSKEPVEVQPDVCETPSPPAGPVPIPYPNTDSASNKESVGDETGTSDDKSEIGFLKELARTKVFGVPLWIWGLLVVSIIVALWIVSSNSPHPIGPME